MKHAFSYFRLTFKQALVMMLHMSFRLSLVIVLLFALITGGSHVFLQAQTFDKIDIAIVEESEQPEVDLITGIVGAVDSVRSVCDFSIIEKETAISALKSGSVQAVIFLGDDFYNDVNNGINTPVTVMLEETPSLQTDIFRELLGDGVSIVRTTESAIYAVTGVSGTVEMKVSRNEMENLLTSLFIKTALERNRLFDSVIVSPTGAIDFTQYYTGVFITIVALLYGFWCAFLYRKQNKAAELQLKMYGVDSAAIGIIRVVIMTILLWIVMVITYLLILLGIRLGIPISMKFRASVVYMLVIPALSMAGFFHMVYSIGDGTGHTGMILFLLDLFMIICCGMVVPSVYLSSAVRSLGKFLPLSWWREIVSQMLFTSGKRSGNTLIITLVLAALFTGIGEIICVLKSRKELA